MSINPYVAGNPVGETDAFVGRDDILQEVLRVLRQPQSNTFLLFGQRRVGKTSILERLSTELPKAGSYYPIYFDLHDKAASPLSEVLGELAEKIAFELNLPEPDLGEAPEKTFRTEWLPQILGQLDDDASIVLLFDEFDVLADPQAAKAADTFFPYFSKLLTVDLKRLQFVFVIGRNVADLANIALSLFKGTPSKRVSLLSEQNTRQIIRLSEIDDTLLWSDEALDYVWELTNGHPFLTQQVCLHVWERAYDTPTDEVPVVQKEDVEAVLDNVLDSSRNSLEWLWDGLPSAERIVSSALAELESPLITQDELEQHLQESGVRVVIRDLQNAPQQLSEWDILEEAADEKYRFRVELLRQWIKVNKPLKRIQAEMDFIEPAAQSLYSAAQNLHSGGQLKVAILNLQQAIELNPNHQGANYLLADIYISQNQYKEAQVILEGLYKIQPRAARPRLVQTLLRQTSNVSDDDQLNLFAQILKFDANNIEAKNGISNIWVRRAEEAFKKGHLQTAQEAYEKAGFNDKAQEMEQAIRTLDFKEKMQQLENLKQRYQFSDALVLIGKLEKGYPDKEDWRSLRNDVSKSIDTAESYDIAIGALRGGDSKQAENLFIEVATRFGVNYNETTRYLHQISTGIDVQKVQQELDSLKEKYEQTFEQLSESNVALNRETEELDRLNSEYQKLEAVNQEITAARDNYLESANYWRLGFIIAAILIAVIVIYLLFNSTPQA